MGSIVPGITEKAGELKLDLASLAAIQKKLSDERFQLKNTLERLTEHQLKVGSLVQRRQAEARKASRSAIMTGREIAQFADEAASLKELIEELARRAAKEARERPSENIERTERGAEFRPESLPLGDVKGTLPYPVMGKVVTKFGTREMVGEARGIRIESRPGAQVVAPYDGKIVFAGPFRHYGQLLIIEHGDGYHSLLAGFGQLYGSIGQWVLTGEPVGVMTAKKSANQLYLELRSEGRAINPEPWLARRMASRN
jgi:septal ring factor EnvC (AmiA/AmiB activator)